MSAELSLVRMPPELAAQRIEMLREIRLLDEQAQKLRRQLEEAQRALAPLKPGDIVIETRGSTERRVEITRADPSYVTVDGDLVFSYSGRWILKGGQLGKDQKALWGAIRKADE